MAASLVFVVQSPWAGLFVPSASAPDGIETDVEMGAEVEVEVEGERVEAGWLLEHDAKKANVATSKMEPVAAGRRKNAVRIRRLSAAPVVDAQGLW